MIRAENDIKCKSWDKRTKKYSPSQTLIPEWRTFFQTEENSSHWSTKCGSNLNAEKTLNDRCALSTLYLIPEFWEYYTLRDFALTPAAAPPETKSRFSWSSRKYVNNLKSFLNVVDFPWDKPAATTAPEWIIGPSYEEMLNPCQDKTIPHEHTYLKI